MSRSPNWPGNYPAEGDDRGVPGKLSAGIVIGEDGGHPMVEAELGSQKECDGICIKHRIAGRWRRVWVSATRELLVDGSPDLSGDQLGSSARQV